jgi:hypothetical protein
MGLLQGLEQRQDRRDGGFAGLATAVEQEARMRVFEDRDLLRVGLHAEAAHDRDIGGNNAFFRIHGELACRYRCV